MPRALAQLCRAMCLTTVFVDCGLARQSFTGPEVRDKLEANYPADRFTKQPPPSAECGNSHGPCLPGAIQMNLAAGREVIQ
jgi:hypothetical protein